MCGVLQCQIWGYMQLITSSKFIQYTTLCSLAKNKTGLFNIYVSFKRKYALMEQKQISPCCESIPSLTAPMLCYNIHVSSQYPLQPSMTAHHHVLLSYPATSCWPTTALPLCKGLISYGIRQLITRYKAHAENFHPPPFPFITTNSFIISKHLV